jgi:hypothetical protein
MSRYAIVLVLFLTSCRPVPMNYQLTHLGTKALLVPPRQPSLASTTEFRATVKNARRHFPSMPACDIERGAISLHWRGGTAEVRLKTQLYSTVLGTPALQGSISSIPLGPLQTMEAFRADLFGLQSKGCLTPSEAASVLREITEKIPLPPDAAYNLRFGTYAFTGYFDLTSDFRLQIVRPIYADSAVTSAGPSASKIAGFETSYYLLTAAQNDTRIRISLSSVTEFRPGKPIFEKTAPLSAPPFPKEFSFYRLVFRRSREAENQVTIAIILASTSDSKLNEAAKLIESTNSTEAANPSIVKKSGDPLKLNDAPIPPNAPPENPCDPITAPGVACISFPPTFAVNPELRILANGKESFVPPGAGVARIFETMRPQPPLADILKTLQVQRQFQGHLIPILFDPSSRDIFYLELMPGDRISW